jgi:F-type H+-transporting ATPase subunit b
MKMTAMASSQHSKSIGFVSGHRFSDATRRVFSTSPLGAVLLALLALLLAMSSPVGAQNQSAPASSAQNSAGTAESNRAKDPNQSSPDHKGFGGELAQQEREATGAEEEENSNLKHSSMVQLLARKTGLSVHQAHIAALSLNFAIIVIVILWAARKFLPDIFRNRSASIQQALAEARTASEDANRRLSDIENRLRQLDGEIGQMQTVGEKEADAEESRIRKAAEEDIRKVVLSAEQEIAAASKQARRELTAHTAGLAIALARKQINVDSNTDQVLIRSFGSKLALESSDKDRDDRGKDGR